MNKTVRILYAFLVMTCSSCISIYFTEPQSFGGKELFEFPEIIHGEWKNEEFVITIKREGISESKFEQDSILGKTVLVYSGLKSIEENFRLFQYKNYFVLNVKSVDSHWEICIIEIKKNKDVLIYRSVEPILFLKDKDLNLVEAHYIVDGIDTITKCLNPEYENQLEFQSATFSGQMSMKSGKKIAKSENLMMILKNDGTIWSKL